MITKGVPYLLNSAGNLSERQEILSASLLSADEAVLKDGSHTTTDERLRARLAVRGHQAGHTLLGDDTWRWGISMRPSEEKNCLPVKCSLNCHLSH